MINLFISLEFYERLAALHSVITNHLVFHYSQDAGKQRKYGDLRFELESGVKLSGPSNDYVVNDDIVSLYQAVQNQRKELSQNGNYITYSIEDEEVGIVSIIVEWNLRHWDQSF